MKRVIYVLVAFGFLATAAAPAWASNYHPGHYHGSPYVRYYQPYCNAYITTPPCLTTTYLPRPLYVVPGSARLSFRVRVHR
jgi:hypothetical protein